MSPEFDAILAEVEKISSKFDYCLIPGEVCTPLKIGKKQIQFEWVSRKPRLFRSEMRSKLGLSLHQDSALLSFGGHAVKALPVEVWQRFENFDFFVLVPNAEIISPPAKNVHLLSSEEWSEYHTDLVDTVDVVIGKLGYGLVSEVLHTKSKFLIVERKGNPECFFLKKALSPVVPLRVLTYEQFINGDWFALNEIVNIERDPLEYVDCATHGEEAIAKWIRDLLGDKKPRYWEPRTLMWPAVTVLVLFLAVLWMVI
jgi:hypothetical protein